jgi:DNA repair exonuclease SbcCD nuclease subunit
VAGFLDDEARPRFLQARLDAVRRIGRLANERGAAFVVVCGDVFESNQLDRRVVSQTFEALRAFTVPVVLLPGNHDPLDAASIYTSAVFAAGVPGNVHVLRNSEPFEVVPGVEIVGAPWFSKRPERDLVAEACAPLSAAPPGILRVIAGHGAVSTLNPDQSAADTIDVEALRGVIHSGRAHVAVLGDKHSTTEVDPAIWYPGTPEVTHRREVDPGNVIVIDMADGEVGVEPVHVGAWTFQTLEAQLDNAEDVGEFARRVRAIPDKARTAIWLALSGTLTMEANARLEQAITDARDVFARFDFWERHTDLAVIADDADFRGLGAGGFTRAAVAELTATAESSGDQASTAGDALRLLYRLAGGVR